MRMTKRLLVAACLPLLAWAALALLRPPAALAVEARLTDDAYGEALRLIERHRAPLDRLTQALLEKETLVRAEVEHLLGDIEPESRASETVGTPRILSLPSEG